MDKIEKALAKLSPKEREQTKTIFKELQAKRFKNLDIKKLKGRDDIFRVRRGSLRIIYRVHGGSISILVIERRSEKTYKF